MAQEILDGTGEGFRAKVDERGRLFSDSIAREQIEYAILTGNGYNVSTGGITLTTGNESAIGWFKYNGADTCVVKEILVILGASTGGAGSISITLLKNPTTGTVITNAVPVSAASNRDFSSSTQLDALAYKGAEGETLTDGEVFGVTTRDASFSGVVAFDAAPIILRKGNSVGIKIDPPSGNTAQTVTVAGTIYIETVKI